MTSRQDADAVVQAIQKCHSSLTPTQQRLLERALDYAQRYTPGGQSEPDVAGYQAPKGQQQGYTQQHWTKFGQYLQSTPEQGY
jgi:hypothetical protein